MLGSTDGGARIAAKLGLPFVFAHHFHPHFTEPALELYRALFEPSELLAAPRTIVAAGIVVGDDDEDALRRALPGGVAMLRLRQGRPAPIPSVEDAEALVRAARGERAGGGPGRDRPARSSAGRRRSTPSCSTSSSGRAPTSSCSSRRSSTPSSASRRIERVAQAFELAPQASGRVAQRAQ